MIRAPTGRRWPCLECRCAADAAAPLQGITLTLADLGIPTESAALDVRELRIVARTPGAAGNSIRITVAPQLTRTATQFSLLADWSAGTALRSGSQWDFGGLPLTARGELDAFHHRGDAAVDPGRQLGLSADRL